MSCLTYDSLMKVVSELEKLPLIPKKLKLNSKFYNLFKNEFKLVEYNNSLFDNGIQIVLDNNVTSWEWVY